MATMYIQNNIIYISAMILNEETGRKVRKKKSTKLKDTRANRKHVEERLLPRFEKELREGKIAIPRKVYTIRELGAIYIEQKKLDSTRAYTSSSYEKALNMHIYPLFGNMLPNNITTADIDKWQTALLSTLSIGSVKNIKIPFNQIFELAINKKLIDINPFRTAVKIFRTKDIKKQTKIATELRPFSEAEIKLLIKNSTGMLRNWIELFRAKISFSCRCYNWS